MVLHLRANKKLGQCARLETRTEPRKSGSSVHMHFVTSFRDFFIDEIYSSSLYLIFLEQKLWGTFICNIHALYLTVSVAVSVLDDKEKRTHIF